MQCWNCEFENIPGVAACGRCGSPLDLDAVAVQPPRASALRLGTRAARVWHLLGPLKRIDLERLLTAVGVRLPERMRWQALARSIIPGWGQLWLGRRQLGRILLGGWLGLLLLTLLSVATSWMPYCYMLATAVHAFAVLAVFADNLAWERVFIRAAFGALTFAALWYGLYRPPVWLGSQYVVPVGLPELQPGQVLQSYDGILVTGEWLRPAEFARGDILLYEIPARGEVNARVMLRGYGVDRVVGVPGDRIQIRDGVMLLNGEPPPPEARPLGPMPGIHSADFTLRWDEYAILPSRLPPPVFHGRDQDRAAAIDGAYIGATKVRYRQIIGRVVFRLRPLSRMGFIE